MCIITEQAETCNESFAEITSQGDDPETHSPMMMPSPRFNGEQMTEVHVALDDCVLLNPEQVNSPSDSTGGMARDPLRSAAGLQIPTKTTLVY
jgi:hypothetical protein